MDIPLLEHRLMAPAKPFPPWLWRIIDCDTSFVEVTKHAPEAHIHMHFLELQFKYSCPEYYTDASKSHAGVSYAAVGPSYSESDVLHSHTSIFTAEAYALWSAAKHIKQLKLRKAVIYTDSLSVVKTLMSCCKHRNPVITDLFSTLCTIYACGQHVTVCWVPGHRGIKGNVLADEIATSIVRKSSNSSMVIPTTDLKPHLRNKLRSYWQKMWDNQTSNKLHLIKPCVGYWPPTTKVRRNEVLLCRLRIGHTYGTHSHLLTGDESPLCGRCGESLTVLHVLVECREAEVERKKHFPKAYRWHIPLHPALFLGFEPVFDHKSLLNFLRDVNILHVVSPQDS